MLFSWFTSKKDVQKDLRILQEQIKRLENTLAEGRNQHIHIEHLTVENPKLESLNFRLDSLDVDELSGSLNLGNNFGVKVNRQYEAKQSKKTTPTTSDAKGSEEAKPLKKTDSGYRFYLNREK